MENISAIISNAPRRLSMCLNDYIVEGNVCELCMAISDEIYDVASNIDVSLEINIQSILSHRLKNLSLINLKK